MYREFNIWMINKIQKNQNIEKIDKNRKKLKYLKLNIYPYHWFDSCNINKICKSWKNHNHYDGM